MSQRIISACQQGFVTVARNSSRHISTSELHKQMDYVNLHQLHEALHKVEEKPLSLHGFRLHPEAHATKPVSKIVKELAEFRSRCKGIKDSANSTLSSTISPKDQDLTRAADTVALPNNTTDIHAATHVMRGPLYTTQISESSSGKVAKKEPSFLKSPRNRKPSTNTVTPYYIELLDVSCV